MLIGALALIGTLHLSAIEWIAPTPPCPTLAEIEDAVRAMAGRTPEPTELHARAVVVHSGERWTLELTMEAGGDARMRVLEAESCDALAKATAILVAVSLDPIAAAHEVRSLVRPRPEPRRPVDAPAPIAPGPVVAPVPAPAVRARAPVRVHLGIGGGVIVGALPGVSGGPAAAIGLGVGRFRAELRGAWWAPRLASSAGVSARVQLGTVSVVACGEPGTPRTTFPICAGIESGAMRGRGERARNPTTKHLAWLAAVVAAGVRGWVRPRIGLRGDVEVAVPIASDRVRVGSRLVHENARVGARALVGVEFRLR